MHPVIWALFDFLEFVVIIFHAKRVYMPLSHKLRTPRTMKRRDPTEMTTETIELMWIYVQMCL